MPGCKNIRDAVDVIEFWKVNRAQLPKLYELAKKILNFPVSTASVERSFSKYNSILTSSRKSLLPNHLTALNFIYYNSNTEGFYDSFYPILDENEISDIEEIGEAIDEDSNNSEICSI